MNNTIIFISCIQASVKEFKHTEFGLEEIFSNTKHFFMNSYDVTYCTFHYTVTVKILNIETCMSEQTV